jgi:hypothetical protein
MPLRVGRYTSVVLLALMLPCAGKFAKVQDPPVPPLYWEYRDLVLSDKPDLFIRLTIVPRFYMGDPPTYVDATTVALRGRTKDSSRGAPKDCCDDSKILSQFGPFQSGERLSADVISIHGKTWCWFPPARAAAWEISFFLNRWRATNPWPRLADFVGALSEKRRWRLAGHIVAVESQ